jgi:hypothetical protein
LIARRYNRTNHPESIVFLMNGSDDDRRAKAASKQREHPEAAIDGDRSLPNFEDATPASVDD